jgi:hypothetical protein
MPIAIRNALRLRHETLTVTHTVTGSPQRQEVERFIHATYHKHYGADVTHFAPNLMVLQRRERIVAAAGWRCAADDQLFLERYLDMPIDVAVATLAGHPVDRKRIVEVGNLAAGRAGGSVDVILALARHLDALGYEWVVFTATRELIGIFRKLGVPPLALAPANPGRLGDGASAWGSYYDNEPIVVAGRIRLALDKVACRHD